MPSKYREPTSVGDYLSKLSRFPLLSAEEELSLAKDVQAEIGLLPSNHQVRLNIQKTLKTANSEDREVLLKGDRAIERLVNSNLRWVVKIAKGYTNRGVALSDLIQEGNKGLMRAVEKFSPQEGCKLSTYSYWWIMQGLTRAIADQSRLIRLPVHIHEKLTAISKASRQISSVTNKKATVQQIAEKLGWEEKEVQGAIDKNRFIYSLDVSFTDDAYAETLLTLIQSTDPTPNEVLETEDFKVETEVLLEKLTDRERDVIILRYGLKDGNEMTLQAVGNCLNLSKERARQLENKALLKMRKGAKMRTGMRTSDRAV